MHLGLSNRNFCVNVVIKLLTCSKLGPVWMDVSQAGASPGIHLIPRHGVGCLGTLPALGDSWERP